METVSVPESQEINIPEAFCNLLSGVPPLPCEEHRKMPKLQRPALEFRGEVQANPKVTCSGNMSISGSDGSICECEQLLFIQAGGSGRVCTEASA